MNKLLVIILLSGIIINAQTDWERWSAADVSYEITQPEKPNYRVDNSSVGSFLLTGLQSTYGFFISDVDGDNCPFYPTCSTFYVESVKETNFFQGTLMFADRFTRDTNLFKSKSHYPHHQSGKLYDPVNNYTLDFNKVNYYSRDTEVE